MTELNLSIIDISIIIQIFCENLLIESRSGKEKSQTTPLDSIHNTNLVTNIGVCLSF